MTRPHLPPQPPLTNEEKLAASQFGNFVQQTRQSIEAAGEAVTLRKWCVERSIEATGKEGPPAFLIDNNGRVGATRVEFACVSLAREIYDFVAEPIKSTLDSLEELAKKGR